MHHLLRVNYKSGEILLIRLHPMFFKEKKLPIKIRAEDIARRHNAEPWKIVVLKDGEIKFEKIIRKNDPAPLVSNTVQLTDHQVFQRKQQKLLELKKHRKQWLQSVQT